VKIDLHKVGNVTQVEDRAKVYLFSTELKSDFH